MSDICVVGSGPAGLSAAIYGLRAGKDVTVFSAGYGALSMAKRVDNYFGFASVSGKELLEIGTQQVLALGGKIIQQEITGIEQSVQGFILHTPDSEYNANAVVLAVGRPHTGKSICGEKDWVGKGVSYCAVCDGFFFRKKSVAVLGCGAYAASEAQQLLNFTKDVTVYTDGLEPEAEMPCAVRTEKIDRIIGEQKVTGLAFEKGDLVPIDGVFVARGTAGANELALKLGIRVDGGFISVNKDGMTNLSGVFAAGDCLGGLCQVSTAIGSGALAGQRAAEFVRRFV